MEKVTKNVTYGPRRGKRAMAALKDSMSGLCNRRRKRRWRGYLMTNDPETGKG